MVVQFGLDIWPHAVRHATTAGIVKENVTIIVGIPSSLFQSHISGYFQIASLYFVLLMNNLLTC